MHYLEHLGAIAASLGRFFQIKVVAATLLSFYSFFFHPDHQTLMLSLVALIIFDFITGVSAASMNKNVITSRKMVKTAIKFGIYCVLISSAHLAEVIVLGDLYLEEAMIGFLAITELVSIIENAGKMGYAVPKNILKKLQQLRGDDPTNEKETTTATK